jgi:hypothetical protein
MNTLRLLSLGLAVAAALLLVSGSLGFTSTAADRDISVTTADDDSAYVGYEPAPDSWSGSIIALADKTEHSLVEVDNRLDSALEVTDVRSESTHIDVEPTKKPSDIGPGTSGTIRGQLTCDEALIAIERVGVTVTVEATSVEAKIDGDERSREFTAVCLNNPFDHLEYTHQGSSAASTATTASRAAGERVTPGDSVQAVLTISNENGTVDRVPGRWIIPRRGIETDLGGGYELVGVEFPRQGLTFAPPGATRAAQPDTGSINIARAVDALDGFEPG